MYYTLITSLSTAGDVYAYILYYERKVCILLSFERVFHAEEIFIFSLCEDLFVT